ncbi:hypothetical protein N7509_000907 [Penicillium cosmopolitanum]|uniref:2EXR domain-containing protein n=1 Tax=Penicillium cosmopolitanum TaxID=1131564 RepID=A0A9W9WB61_9EURO|nr:uncharacterized protein N7509_000907 [Penicillium cosmopolitanum]KAJ5414280.1 hypothetical protein N7509_000907 [Penicillium cosmopolitanum]
MATEFLLFPFLPWELRRMIWLECLEGRVVELEVPPVMFLSAHSENCLSWTAHQNTRPPVLTRVCKESREAALSQCAWALDERDVSHLFVDYIPIPTRNPWFNPAKDIISFSSPGCFYPDEGAIYGPDSYYMEFAKQVQDIVIPARLIYPLRYLRLPMELGGAEAKNFPGGSRPAKAIEVHMPPEQFLASTLSGRTGDSLVQVVDIFDAVQIEKIWQEGKNVYSQEQDILTVFGLLRNTEKLRREVAKWQEDVKMSWMCQRYGASHSYDHRVYDEEHGIPPRKAECFVNPPGSESSAEPMTRARFVECYAATPPRFDEFEFDMEDPWVRWAYDEMPTFRPVIMFRLCVRGCASLCSTNTRREMYSGRYLHDYADTLMEQYQVIRLHEREEEKAMAAGSRKILKRL